MTIFLNPLATHLDNGTDITYDQVLANLRQLLRAMLKDGGYQDAFSASSPECKVFTDEELTALLEGALSYFNGIPHFTDYTFITLPQRWYMIITQGAFLLSLAAQGLREVGREFNITDNGISFTPPAISAYLQTVHSTQYATWITEIDKIKSNIKPQPRAVGTFRVLALNPALLRLRHLREK